MKKNLSKFLIAVMLFFLPAISNGQVITLGSSSQFVLFTSVGAITNSGTNFQTRLTGKVGSNSGSSTGFGNVDGTMHSGDATTAAATASLTTAYTQLNTATPTGYPSATLGNDTFVAGVYSIPGAATLTSTITLDAQGNPNAVFIFQINGSFSAASNSKVRIINGGLACNVYWQTEGLASFGSGSTIRGTILAHNAAISFGTLDTLEGRALSLNGAITLNSLTGYTPTGCGSTTLTGPTAPTLGAVGSFALFSSNGPVTNGGAITYVTGDIGTNLGLTTGYNPLYVNGTIHPIPDGATAAAATALTSAYTQLNTLSTDIELLYPAIFGNNLVLTPHTYLLNAATSLTDTVFLNAQGNSNAVFVIKINGALSVTSGAYVKLINGTQIKNVYWKVEGAVGFANNTTFQGTVVANNGAIDITAGTNFNGRALTTTGALTTNGATINAPVLPTTGTITSDSVVCVGATIPLTGVDTGGTWSVSNNHATISSTGIFTGVSAGVDTAKYTVTNSFGTATTTKRITVNPLPNAGTISGPSSVCVGSTITLTDAAPGGVWSSSNATATVVGGLVTGISPGIDTIRYSVTNTCGTAVATKIINIYAIPNVNVIANQIVCNGTPTTAVNFSGAVSGTTFSWTNDNTSIGLAGTGIGNIPSYTAINTTNVPATGNIVVTPSANGCTGSTKNFTYTVNPSPNAATVANQAVCNGAPTTAVAFTGTVSGTSYSWTNDNTSIGLAGTGIGNIPSFTGLNATNIPATGNVVVTPSANGCTGATKNFSITVNPTPNAATIANQAVCNGAPTTAVIYTGTVSGTAFSWTNDNTSIGLAGAGSGNIPSFIGLNSTNIPATGNVIVTPSANGCTGATKNFSITVNPTPNAATVASQVMCNGTPTTAVNFTGTVSGSTFSWTNDNTSIGLAGTGSGNIPSFTALNTTNVPTIGNIIVTPHANGCVGPNNSFTYTVNPTPNTDVVANMSVCNGLPTTAVNFTGTVSGSTFSWTNSNTSIGLAGAGSGNIPSFTAINTTNTPVIATISIVPTANGCTGLTSTFTITVNNTPTAPIIALTTPSSVCNITYFRNFGAATLPPAGINYSWSAINASISDTGSTQQYALVNFKKVGVGTVVLTATVINTGCLNTAHYDVNVTSNVADTTAQVIYFNKSFVCLQNNEEAYAWGYDDSRTLAPTWLSGEINQDYVNVMPNLESNRYWVMVTHNGCTQKTYFNKPEGALMRIGVSKLTIFPNPATEQIKIGLTTAAPGDILMEIYNTQGKKMYTANSITDNNTVDISTYPMGLYLIICYRNNEKITASFIKH